MMLTESDLRDVLREACQKEGSQMAWADRHGLSRSYVSDLLNGHRPFSDRALTAIGCERRYVRVDRQPDDISMTHEQDLVWMAGYQQGYEEARRERESVELIPADQWSELDGAVLWWYFPIAEPPYCGTPLDSDWPTLSGESFYTHFTRIPLPQPPLQSRKSLDVKA